jgi:hypothetical protein
MAIIQADLADAQTLKAPFTRLSHISRLVVDPEPTVF